MAQPSEQKHPFAVETVEIVNPKAAPAKRELIVNASELEAWRARGYRLASEPEPELRSAFEPEDEDPQC